MLFLTKKFYSFELNFKQNETKYKYNMASVVGSSYVSQEFKSHIGIFRNMQACSLKSGFFYLQ